jgi:hypothetical protein
VTWKVKEYGAISTNFKTRVFNLVLVFYLFVCLSIVEQVAELVEFLCLSHASSQMTGAAYLIESGYTAA